jgi:uncharacterized protein GlcG (DUF336 family)
MAGVFKKHCVSSELAQKMVDEAVAKAKEIGVSEDVAILDDGGSLKAFSGMDGDPILSIRIAQDKAYTALFGIPTRICSTSSKETHCFWLASYVSTCGGVPEEGFPSKWRKKLSARSG